MKKHKRNWEIAALQGTYLNGDWLFLARLQSFSVFDCIWFWVRASFSRQYLAPAAGGCLVYEMNIQILWLQFQTITLTNKFSFTLFSPQQRLCHDDIDWIIHKLPFPKSCWSCLLQFMAIDLVKELLVRLTSSNKFLKAGYVAVLLRSKCVLQIISTHVFLVTEKSAHSDIPIRG